MNSTAIALPSDWGTELAATAYPQTQHEKLPVDMENTNAPPSHSKRRNAPGPQNTGANQESTHKAPENLPDVPVLRAPVTPQLQPFDPAKIPQQLKANPRWAPWKAVWNVKRQKFDKIPCSFTRPHHGISTAKPDRWGTFDQAVKACEDNPDMLAGVGYLMTGLHGVVGIDLDNCVDLGQNHIDDWAQDVVHQLGSYTEVSPSGKGLRIMVLGAVPNDWTNHDVGIEVYGGHEPRFLTVSGQRLRASVHDVLAPDVSVMDTLAAQYAKAKPGSEVVALDMPDMVSSDVLPSLDSLTLPTGASQFLMSGDHGGDRSRALFASAVALYNTGLPDDQVFSLLAHNEHAMAVALDHRRQDHDKALMYLWVEHCQKGKAKSTPVASLADFECLAPPSHTPATSGNVIALHGDADDFDVVDDVAVHSQTTAPTLKPKFFAEPAGEFALGAIPPWLVKGLIPQAELGMLFGESGAGKSFVMVDLACAVARGLAWRGNKVRQGKVVYVCAEGAKGFRKRLRAYAIANCIDVSELSENLRVISSAPNLMVKDDALAVAKSINACGKVVLVIVDTMAQVMPGANENSGEDVGKVLQHCKGIHAATQAMVLLVHHSGKDASKGSRGWSGMKGAMDVELEVSKCPDGVRKLRDSKQKDEEDGREWGFTLRKLPIGVDEEGDMMTSCVVVEAAVPVPTRGGAGANKNGGVWAARVLEVLGELTLVQTTGIEKKAVIEEVLRRSPAGTDNNSQANRALRKILLDDESEYVLEDGCISLIE